MFSELLPLITDKYRSTAGCWKLKENIVFVFITYSERIEPASISTLLSFVLIAEIILFFAVTNEKIINGMNPRQIRVNFQ